MYHLHSRKDQIHNGSTLARRTLLYLNIARNCRRYREAIRAVSASFCCGYFKKI